MRAVLVAVGSRGDAVPFAALAAELVRRGHDVRLITHASLTSVVPPGVPVVGVDSDPHDLIAGPAGEALRRGDVAALNRTRDLFAQFLGSVAEPARDALQDADVLVASTMAVAAVHEADLLGVPVVRGHLWPESEGAEGPMPLLPYAWRLPDPVRRQARRGLRAIEPYFAGVEGGWTGRRLDLEARHPVGLTTASLGAIYGFSPIVEPAIRQDERTCVTGWWRSEPTAELDPELRRLLGSGDRWIAVGFGSMTQSDPGQVVEIVSQACRIAGVRAVLQLAGAPPDPTGAVVPIGPAPHDDLFRAVRGTGAVVHHGGSGTTGTALAAGVPQVVVPHLGDQYHWAHRLQTLGVASSPLPRRLLTSRRLAGRIEEVTRAPVVRRAEEIGRAVAREDGVARAVDHLEHLMTLAPR